MLNLYYKGKGEIMRIYFIAGFILGILLATTLVSFFISKFQKKFLSTKTFYNSPYNDINFLNTKIKNFN